MIGTVVWDWNGTLLDDTQACLDAENELLEARGLGTIDKERYLEIFGFPVIDYYRRAGLTFETESFEVVAAEYHELYREKAKMSRMYRDAVQALRFFKEQGMRQVVLSAAQKELLLDQLSPFDITAYFDTIIGQDDLYANGKINAALKWMGDHNVDPSSVALIGDTTHDYETASALGAFCVLVPNGHQSRKRLLDCVGDRCVIADSLTDAAQIICSFY